MILGGGGGGAFTKSCFLTQLHQEFSEPNNPYLQLSGREGCCSGYWVNGSHRSPCRSVLLWCLGSHIPEQHVGFTAWAVNSQLRKRYLLRLMCPSQLPQVPCGCTELEHILISFSNSLQVWSLTPRLQSCSEPQRCLRQWFPQSTVFLKEWLCGFPS